MYGKDGRWYHVRHLEKVNVVAADGSKAIAMFKLPGGTVVAHGSQQPDREKAEPDMEKSRQTREMMAAGKIPNVRGK